MLFLDYKCKMDLKSQQNAAYFESLKQDQNRINQFYEEAFKVPDLPKEESKEEPEEPEIKLTSLEMRQARIKYFST
jgi:hypothetical protein